MTEIPQSLAVWSDVNGENALPVSAAEITLSPGIDPSIATLSIAPFHLSSVEYAELKTAAEEADAAYAEDPTEENAAAAQTARDDLDAYVRQAYFYQSGNLVFFDGTQAVGFTGMRAAELSVVHQAGEVTMSLLLQDRRWRWEFLPTIDGEYNARDDQDNLLPDEAQKRSADWLIRYAAQAMGEEVQVLAPIPDDFPYVYWDHVNPARALYDLCEKYGLLIVLRTDDTVAIRARGDGLSDLQDGRFHTVSERATREPRPEKIVAVTHRPQIQVEDIPLEAVGLDYDAETGTTELKALADLSYAPVGGWTPAVGLILGLQGQPENAGLWERTVLRWYRLPETLDVGGTLYTRDELCRTWLEELVVPAVTSTGVERRDRPFARGRYMTMKSIADDEWAGNTSATTRVGVGFRFLKEHGVVEFDEPVFTRGSQFVGFSPATLTLTAAFLGTIWDDRRRQERTLEGGEVGQVRLEFCDATPLVRDGALLNAEEVAEAQTVALDAAEKEYAATTTPRVEGYPYILDVSPDGVVNEVTWRVDEQGPLTTVAFGVEISFTRPRAAAARRAKASGRLVDERRRKPATGYNQRKGIEQ